jgi:rSAM/selenodomain-associated transferase 2
VRIGVVVPALNEAALIGAALARLRGVPVTVADGGSSDATRELAAAAGARVVVATGGRGAQQNAGAAALGDVDALLFLHADTILPNGWRAEVERILAGGAALGAFRLAIPGHPLIAAGANARSRLLALPYGDQALFIGRPVFDTLGGFRPLPIMEDYDLVRRARRLGRIGLARTAVTTSNRRWRRRGVVRTTLVNQAVLAGWALGIAPDRLAAFYRR